MINSLGSLMLGKQVLVF